MSTEKILYQGDPGSYSYEAMLLYFGENITYENKDFFSNVFEDISNNKAEFGIVPIENSTTGGVYEVFDLLNIYDNCFIVGEICVEINHNLMATKNTNIESIKKVYSHPQALGQCEDYIRKMHFEPVPARNTASSAKMIMEMNDPTCAAIASKIAAKFYNLDILNDNINNLSNNITKFIIISNKRIIDENSNKISLIMITAHKPGALYEALGYFAKNNINILKLESRPIKNTPWKYSFYVDIEGNLNENKIQNALKELNKSCTKYKILGNYKCDSTLL